MQQRVYSVREGTRDGALIGTHTFDEAAEGEHEVLSPREFELAGAQWRVIDFYVVDDVPGDENVLVVEKIEPGDGTSRA